MPLPCATAATAAPTELSAEHRHARHSAGAPSIRPCASCLGTKYHTHAAASRSPPAKAYTSHACGTLHARRAESHISSPVRSTQLGALHGDNRFRPARAVAVSCARHGASKRGSRRDVGAAAKVNEVAHAVHRRGGAGCHQLVDHFDLELVVSEHLHTPHCERLRPASAGGRGAPPALGPW